jgi:Fe-S-cluster containining protein
MWDCRGCKDSCCVSKRPALNRADVTRIAKEVDNVLNFIAFRGDVEGREVEGNKFNGVLSLREIDGHCIFYENELCKIYESRPTVCKLYPYNPCFTEKSDATIMKLSTNKCKEIDNDHSFEYMDYALQWRNERMVYDKIVDEWNKNENKNLVDFIRELTNGTHSND